LSRFYINWLSACFIGLLLLSGCSNRPTSKVEDPGQKSEVSPVLPGNYNRAQILMRSGDYQAAIPVLLDFIDNNPELAGPYLNLGIAYQHTDQNEAAMDALKKTVELNPATAAAHHHLGILYREKGDFGSALSSYEKALKLDAGYALVHRNIGILYDLYLGQPALALEHYKTYLELSAEPDPSVDRWLADLQRRSGSAQARTDQ